MGCTLNNKISVKMFNITICLNIYIDQPVGN